MCHAMWQWKAHRPGLSATNRISAHEYGFRVKVSRTIAPAFPGEPAG